MNDNYPQQILLIIIKCYYDTRVRVHTIIEVKHYD